MIFNQVIDANNPGDILESFVIADKHLLCIASIGGHIMEEYGELNSEKSSSNQNLLESENSQPPEVSTGKITLVRMMTLLIKVE